MHSPCWRWCVAAVATVLRYILAGTAVAELYILEGVSCIQSTIFVILRDRVCKLLGTSIEPSAENSCFMTVPDVLQGRVLSSLYRSVHVHELQTVRLNTWVFHAFWV